MKDNIKMQADNYLFNAMGNVTDEIPHIVKVLDENKKRVLKFFGRTGIDQTRIFLFENMKELKKHLNDNNLMEYDKQPKHMCGAELYNGIYYLSKKDPYFKNWTDQEYDKYLCHEFIHLVEDKIFPRHPEWLSEGIAKYLDGSYDDNIFELIKDYEIPNINEMKGETFVTKKYDGYVLSYLMVSYLLEVLGKKDFIAILKNSDQCFYIGKKALPEAIEYYKEELNPLRLK